MEKKFDFEKLYYPLLTDLIWSERIPDEVTRSNELTRIEDTFKWGVDMALDQDKVGLLRTVMTATISMVRKDKLESRHQLVVELEQRFKKIWNSMVPALRYPDNIIEDLVEMIAKDAYNTFGLTQNGTAERIMVALELMEGDKVVTTQCSACDLPRDNWKLHQQIDSISEDFAELQYNQGELRDENDRLEAENKRLKAKVLSMETEHSRQCQRIVDLDTLNERTQSLLDEEIELNEKLEALVRRFKDERAGNLDTIRMQAENIISLRNMVNKAEKHLDNRERLLEILLEE